MTRGILPVVAVALLLGPAGCEGERRSEVGGPCDGPDDCVEGLDCADGVCFDPTPCPGDRPPCGESCCALDERCVDGDCVLECTSGIECGRSCCTLEEVCIEGSCCGPAMVCGESCCRGGAVCVDGECITCPRELCGGRDCCRDHEVCIGESCCPAESACGESCCDEDEVCLDGECVAETEG